MFQQRSEKNIIFAADLPENTTEEELKLFFKDYIDMILMINMNQKRNQFSEHGGSLSAKIIFRDSATANDARINLNQLKFKGKAIRLMWDEKTQIFRSNHNNTNLFVKGIPFNVSQRKVYEHFMQFGDILSLKMSEDEYGNHIGYGYITYYEQESALKAIENCDGKIVFDSRLEVKFFKNRAERIASYGPENNKIYITNFPGNFNENDIISLCENYGEIVSYFVNTETIGRIFAVVCYSTNESAKNAQIELNKKNIQGYNLFCEIYQNKLPMNSVHKPFIGHLNYAEGAKSKTNPVKFNEFCNLTVRNIPYQVDEDTLRKEFEKFGPIKSIKIEKYTLVQKVKGEFKEIPTSRGYGFVCFENKDDAFRARTDLNGKFLPNYESWIKPLFVDYCIPKKEREVEEKSQSLPFEQNKTNTDTYNSTINNNPNQPMGPPVMINQPYNPNIPAMPQNIPQGMNPPNMQGLPPNMMGMPPNMPNMPNMGQGMPNMTNMPPGMSPNMMGMSQNMPPYGAGNNPNDINQNMYYNMGNNQETGKMMNSKQERKMKKNTMVVDEKYLQSLESMEAKKEYLGEIIFKLIEEHPLTQKANLTIDWIGKITGMIINIEDLNEILDVCINENVLVSRINEALELLNTK